MLLTERRANAKPRSRRDRMSLAMSVGTLAITATPVDPQRWHSNLPRESACLSMREARPLPVGPLMLDKTNRRC